MAETPAGSSLEVKKLVIIGDGATRQVRIELIAVLNLSALGFSFVVFHDKAKRTQQGNLVMGKCILNDEVRCYESLLLK